MTTNDKTAEHHSSSKRAARLRLIGIIVLLLGISSAGAVYWLGTRSPDVSDDLSMVGYNKAQTRQMGMLYGKMGPVIEEWFDDLKQPGTQAEIIVAVSILIAAGCFYFARLLGHDDAPSDGGARPGEAQ
jgi:flagellar basal body-associated protein FliL